MSRSSGGAPRGAGEAVGDLRAATAAQLEATRRLTGDRAGEPPAAG
ncbi:hypothetical protein [Geodermatophilus sp. SYSU D00684]